MDAEFERQTQITPVKRHKKVPRKKREIRVFVSSTFRDFMEEREEIIKKAFREVGKFRRLECFQGRHILCIKLLSPFIASLLLKEKNALLNHREILPLKSRCL